jgi:hypothetical protein
MWPENRSRKWKFERKGMIVGIRIVGVEDGKASGKTRNGIPLTSGVGPGLFIRFRFHEAGYFSSLRFTRRVLFFTLRAKASI